VNPHLVGFAIACVICGALDLWRHGWLPFQERSGNNRSHPVVWLIDRTYLIYAAMAGAALVAAALIGR